MERMNEDLIKKDHLINEHYARYDCFSSLIKGHVVDCACGIGYASEIIVNNKFVSKYTGIDISSEAINIANNNYKKNNIVEFLEGDLDSLNMESDSIDTFISMETLEHINYSNLNKCLTEINRVLKDDGVFIGSVPTDLFDNKCEEVYGKNNYHITRFNFEFLKKLLGSFFEFIEAGVISCQIISHYENLIEDKKSIDILSDKYRSSYGSFVFACSNQKIDIDFSKKNYFSQSLVEYDEENLIPFVKSMKYAEELALKREVIINESSLAYESRINDLNDSLRFAEELALKREVIINESSLAYELRIDRLNERLKLAEDLCIERESIIKEKDLLIKSLKEDNDVNK